MDKSGIADDREQEVWNSIVRALRSLPEQDRERVLESVCSFLGMSSLVRGTASTTAYSSPTVQGSSLGPDNPSGSSLFSERTRLSPKEFMLTKEPQTDVERIACLAYYLTHYRDTQHFKTVDLSELNTEAAQPKFSNASYAVNNASQSGYVVSAPGGQKQLSALGEQFVLALPDREAAKSALERFKRRRVKKVVKRASKPSH